MFVLIFKIYTINLKKHRCLNSLLLTNTISTASPDSATVLVSATWGNFPFLSSFKIEFYKVCKQKMKQNFKFLNLSDDNIKLLKEELDKHDWLSL